MPTQARMPFTVDLATRIAGWDPRYATVLRWHEGDGLAIGVFDTNGDGREVEADLFEKGGPDGHWNESASGFGSGSVNHVGGMDLRLRAIKRAGDG